MSCSNKNIQDIESIYSKHDDQFKTINSKNIDKYNKLVTTLFQFYISNKENIKPNSDFKEKFNKLYGKLQKRGDIIVKKSFIVYIYQKLVKENILVNAIAPGAFPSNMLGSAVGHDYSYIEKTNPVKRIGTAEDIGGLALYLSSRAGCYTVGETITCDGGAVCASGHALITE